MEMQSKASKPQKPPQVLQMWFTPGCFPSWLCSLNPAPSALDILLAQPLCRNASGIFVVQVLEDFAGDFPGGFLWALFPHKNEEKKSGHKIREKSFFPPRQAQSESPHTSFKYRLKRRSADATEQNALAQACAVLRVRTKCPPGKAPSIVGNAHGAKQHTSGMGQRSYTGIHHNLTP